MFGFDKAMQKAEAKGINPVVLAFIGDAVFSLFVRERLLVSYEGKSAEYQKSASKIVSASGQNAVLDKLMPLFNDEEMEIYRRARNAKKQTKAKSATAGGYNRSTGLEAVFGYLHLADEKERLQFLFSQIDESIFVKPKEITVYKP